MLMNQLLRQLSSKPSTAPEHDGRSIEAVFETAAVRFGRAREPAVVESLVTSGVEHAQLLAEMSEGDWDRVGVSLGLKLAVKAELADPSQLPRLVKQDHIDKTIRQFLLLPGEDGQEAKPLSTFSSWFLSMVATPVADRQNLLLALCELTALICGLFVPVPLEFRRHGLYATESVDKGWQVSPTVADGIDALAVFIFFLNAFIAFFSVTMALCVASGGWHADDKMCQAVVGVLAIFVFVGFMHMVLWPLFFLTMWQSFTNASSPYPLIGSWVIFYAVWMGIGSMLFVMMTDVMPLEIYHMPWWLKKDLKHSMPWLRKKLSDEYLIPRAKLRAAKLAAQMGIPYPLDDRSSPASPLCVSALPPAVMKVR